MISYCRTTFQFFPSCCQVEYYRKLIRSRKLWLSILSQLLLNVPNAGQPYDLVLPDED